MAFGLYNLKDVTFTFAGLILRNGRGQIAIAQREDSYDLAMSGDGCVTRSDNNATVYDVTLTLYGGSNFNQQLSVIHNADRVAPGGAGVGAMLIEDTNGASVFAAEFAWINKMPDVTFAKTVEDKVWPFVATTNPAAYIVGGNEAL